MPVYEGKLVSWDQVVEIVLRCDAQEEEFHAAALAVVRCWYEHGPSQDFDHAVARLDTALDRLYSKDP